MKNFIAYNPTKLYFGINVVSELSVNWGNLHLLTGSTR